MVSDFHFNSGRGFYKYSIAFILFSLNALSLKIKILKFGSIISQDFFGYNRLTALAVVQSLVIFIPKKNKVSCSGGFIITYISSMIYDKEFKNIDFKIDLLSEVEFDNCTFINCNFSGIDLSNKSFYESEFSDCDLSNVKLVNTAFQEVSFKNCKLLGLRFDECKSFLLAFHFDSCTLNYSSFYQLKIPKTTFIGSSLLEVDFSEADLQYVNFSACDLSGALFGNTILENADFRDSRNFNIDPEVNYIRNAKFSADCLLGLLFKYEIHVD